MFEPVTRQSLSQAVYEQLRDGIVGGRLGTGTKLPSERTLAETLGVNRGAVREALKRLEQARLISVRQGGGARVLDYQANAGMDLLSEILFRDDRVDIDVARGVIEMRAHLGPEIARRCAERATPEVLDQLGAILTDLEGSDDLATRQTASMRFWETLVDGSRNVAYRLAYNSLTASYDGFRGALVQVLEPELRNAAAFRAVLEAVRAGDGEAAAARAAELLALGAESLLTLLNTLESLTGEDA